MSQKVKKEKFASDTSKRSAADWAKALAVLCVGLTVAHFGVTLFLLSGLGTDTFTVLIQGMAVTFHTTVGLMHIIVLTILVILMLVTTKGYIKPGSFVCAILGGIVIDVFTWMLEGRINVDSPMLVRVVSMLAGCVILSVGMSIVINSNAGTGPNDLIAIILSDKIECLEFRWIRVICDVVFVFLGYLLGGTVGVGTVVSMLLTGPLVQFWLPITKKPIEKLGVV